jgi:putative membrane protein
MMDPTKDVVAMVALMLTRMVPSEAHWRMRDDDDGSGWAMALLMLLLLAAVVAAVVVIVLVFMRGSSPVAAAGPSRAPDARAILQERFARGEIDDQEFRARMRALDETAGSG